MKDLMNDKVTIIKPDWLTSELECSFQSKAIYVDWTYDLADEWDRVIRKITDTKSEEYVIDWIEYFAIWDRLMAHTKITYSKSNKPQKNHPANISIWTVNQYWGNFTAVNNWNVIVQDTDIDSIIKLINSQDYKNKEELKSILEEYKLSKDESKIRKFFSLFSDVASLSQLIAWILSLTW